MLQDSSGAQGSSGSSSSSFSNSFQDATAGVRAVVGLQTEQERNESCFPEMSYQMRLYGVLICFGVGTVLSLCSTLFLTTGSVTAFAIIYTMGNIIAIFSSTFMMGWKRQSRMMFKRERLGATLIYFISLIATLIVAFTVSSPAIPCLILVVIQFCAATWYTLSYIPFARQMILSCMGINTGGAGNFGGSTGV